MAEGNHRHLKKSEITRKKIIDEAYELFLRLGFSETTIAMISKAVGVSYGSVYTYFNSKADIFIEIMDDTVKPLYIMARTPFFPTSAKNAYEIIWKQSLSYLSLSVTHKRILEIIDEAIYLSPDVRLKWQHIRDYFLGTITQDIQYSQNVGLLRKGVIPEIAAREWNSTNEFFLWEVLKKPRLYVLEDLAKIISREYVISIYDIKNYDELTMS